MIGEASGAGKAAIMSRRPRIAVIGTGGTFAMQARHRFDWVEYSESGVILGIDHLLTTMGELAPHIDIVPIGFRALGSTGIVPADWLALSLLITSTIDQDPSLDGIVITHGTATLEETAWFLDLTLALDIPVIVTGAQRPANTEGSDACVNLRAALAAACAPTLRGLGVLVVMDNVVLPAREATKVSSFELAAFEAPGFGPLARIDAQGQVALRRLPVRPAGRLPITDLAGVASLPRVDVVLSYAGADRIVIDALVAAGTRGIISAGLPPGRAANGERAALVDAVARGVIVVQSTRAARGTVPMQRFLSVGGILAGGDLSPQKLRIVLMLALTRTSDPDVVQQMLLAY